MMNEMESEFTGSETGQECIPEEKNCQDIAGHSEKYDETRIAFGERLMANLATNENLMRKQMRYFQIAYETDEIQQIGILPFLSGCAFDRVLFRVLVRFPNAEFFLIPVVYRTFKMPQRYYDDLKRGRLKDAISYKNGARALRDGRERRWEISRASWPKKLVEIYGTWLAESQHEFLSYTRAMCYGLIERLNLLDCNPIRSVQEEKSGEYYHLTGWRRKSEGELRFDGVKRRMYCLGYLGTPSMIFYMKRYDRNEWFKGSVQHTAVSFCQLWLCAPSLLLAAAYGILTILPFQRPPKNIKTESGEIALVESMPLPVAMLNELTKDDAVHFLVVEPAKGEYKNAFGGREDVSVYGTNPQKTELLRINPFSFPVDEIHVLEHLDRLVEIFNVCWPMYAAMPAILKDACERAYVAAGWNLAESVNQYDNRLFPTFADVLEQIKVVVNETEYSADTSGDYKGALVTRVKSLTTGINGQIFTPDALRDEDLFDKNVIVDLSRVGSTETKALLMGLLVMKLQEYRMAMQQGTDSALRHVTVLEEAHNLLKRTSTEQSSDSSNLLGKSVEMLGNAIAEMRTYGEGFIIADQAPGLMDMAVIRNTNTKIIMRLPDQSDRELVGKAAGLNDDQIKELAKLPMGVAAVYQNEWLAPVLCKIDHFTDKSKYTGGAYISVVEFEQLEIAENILQILAYDQRPENPEAFRRQVVKSEMNASLKCWVLKYLDNAAEGQDEEDRTVIRAKIAASFFESNKYLAKFSNEETPDAEILENYLKEQLAEYLLDFDEATQRRLITLIVEGACANDIRYTHLADCWKNAML